LGKRYIGLSTQVPDTFPNMEIVEAYVSPVTSWSDGDNGPDLAPLSPEFPNVAKIAAFCERVFTWGGPEGTLKKLQNTLGRDVHDHAPCLLHASTPAVAGSI
jgi:Holliday junction resolvase YEN1